MEVFISPWLTSYLEELDSECAWGFTLLWSGRIDKSPQLQKPIQKLKNNTEAKNPNTEVQKTNTETKTTNTEARKQIQKLNKQIADGIHGNALGPCEPWAPLAPKNHYRS